MVRLLPRPLHTEKVGGPLTVVRLMKSQGLKCQLPCAVGSPTKPPDGLMSGREGSFRTCLFGPTACDHTALRTEANAQRASGCPNNEGLSVSLRTLSKLTWELPLEAESDVSNLKGGRLRLEGCGRGKMMNSHSSFTVSWSIEPM